MAHVLMSGGHVYEKGANVVTDAVVVASSIPLSLTNFGASSVSSPMIEMAQFYRKGDVPAGSHSAPSIAGSPVSAFQTDGEVYWADSSLKLAIHSFKADGAFTAGQVRTDISFVPTVGYPNRSGAISPATIAANSDIYVKVFGGDFAAELPLDTAGDGTIDWYEASLNNILATYNDDKALPWGLNPAGGWTTVRAGPYLTKWTAWCFVVRHSDSAIHKYVKVELHVTALSATGPFVVEWVGQQPNLNGPFPGGTVPATIPGYLTTGQQPRYAGIYECRDRSRSNALIGACGGFNDPRWVGNTTIPTTAFDTSNSRIALPTALGIPISFTGVNQAIAATPNACTGGMGVMFVGASLPAGLLPAPYVYFPATVHFGANNPPANVIYLAHERFYIGAGLGYIQIDNGFPLFWVAGTHFAGYSKAIQVGTNGVLYFSQTIASGGGTTGTTMPAGDGTGISDGSITDWQAVTAVITSQGSGTISMIPVAMTFGNTKVLGVDGGGKAFWYDPVGSTTRPSIGVGHDFNYLFSKTTALNSYSKHDYFQVAKPSGSTYTYIPNMTLVGQFPGQGTPWGWVRNPGDGSSDNRYGGIPKDQILSFYNISDALSHWQMLTIGCQFFDTYHNYHDESTGYPVISNLGPSQSGGAYPNLPAGSTKSSLQLYGIAGAVGVPIRPASNRADAGWVFYYPQVMNSSHMPCPGMAPFLKTGREMFRNDMLDQWFAQLGSQSSADRNNVNPFGNGKTYAGCVMQIGDSQVRSAAHNFRNMLYVLEVTPTSHILAPVIADCFASNAAWLGDFATWQPINDANANALGMYNGTPSFFAPWQSGLVAMYVGLAAKQPDAPPGFYAFINGVLRNMYKWWDTDYGGAEGYVDLYIVETDSRATNGDAITQRSPATTYSSWNQLANALNNSTNASGNGWGLWLTATPTAGLYGAGPVITEGHTAPIQTNGAISFLCPVTNPYFTLGWSGTLGTRDATNLVILHMAALAEISNIPGAYPDALKLFNRLDARIRNPAWFPNRPEFGTPGPRLQNASFISGQYTNGDGSYQLAIRPA